MSSVSPIQTVLVFTYYITTVDLSSLSLFLFVLIFHYFPFQIFPSTLYFSSRDLGILKRVSCHLFSWLSPLTFSLHTSVLIALIKLCSSSNTAMQSAPNSCQLSTEPERSTKPGSKHSFLVNLYHIARFRKTWTLPECKFSAVKTSSCTKVPEVVLASTNASVLLGMVPLLNLFRRDALYLFISQAF